MISWNFGDRIARCPSRNNSAPRSLNSTMEAASASSYAAALARLGGAAAAPAAAPSSAAAAAPSSAASSATAAAAAAARPGASNNNPSGSRAERSASSATASPLAPGSAPINLRAKRKSLGTGRSISAGNVKLHAARLKILNVEFTDVVALSYMDSFGFLAPFGNFLSRFSLSISSFRIAVYSLSCGSLISTSTTYSLLVAIRSALPPL